MAESELDVRFPADPDSAAAARIAACRWAASLGADEGVIDAIALCVSEAATNSVVHAFVEGEPGEIRLQGYAEAGALHIRVIDNGRGMSPRLDSPGLGLGLPLISRMTRTLAVEPGEAGQGTCIHMCFDGVSRWDEPDRLAEGAF